MQMGSTGFDQNNIKPYKNYNFKRKKSKLAPFTERKEEDKTHKVLACCISASRAFRDSV